MARVWPAQFSLILLALTTLPNGIATAAVAAKPGTALLQFQTGGHVLGFNADGMIAATGNHALRVDFVGHNPVQPQAASAPSNTQTSALPLSHVTYPNLWDGVALDYSADNTGIYTTTYTLAPGAKPERIRLHYHSPVSLNANGSLNLDYKTGRLTESAPLAWQTINGKRMKVDVKFRITGQEVSFALGSYDARQPLTIDPTLSWNTFLGGSNGVDRGFAIAVDNSGNVYVAGNSDASWGTPLNDYNTGTDGFVAKLNPQGELLWSTFLGGTGDDYTSAIIAANQTVTVSGLSTESWGNNPKRPFNASGDGFVAQLDEAGNLIWHTFLGGSSLSNFPPPAIVMTGNGNIYVSGISDTSWGNPVQPYNAGDDGYVAGLDSSGHLLWNTFLGADGDESASAIAVDSTGKVYVAGNSNASWGTPLRTYTDFTDGYAAQLDATGHLLWNTFLGGADTDVASSIGLDGTGNIYVGGTSGASWGTKPKRAYSANPDGLGFFDGFVAKLLPSGILVWNTFLGGTLDDVISGLVVDKLGTVTVSGHSQSSWGTPEQDHSGLYDVYLAQIEPLGALGWNTFLGGIQNDFTGYKNLAVGSNGTFYVTGTSSRGWGNPVNSYTSNRDTFVAQLNPGFSSAYSRSGWVKESAPNSKKGGSFVSNGDELRVGDDTDNAEYRSLLHFDTSTLPDKAVITGATLKIKKISATGTDPIMAGAVLTVDAKKNFFGKADALEAKDFEAKGSNNVGAGHFTLIGDSEPDWYQVDLSKKAFKQINTKGTTQFKLRFAAGDNGNSTADFDSFYAGQTPENAPVLIVKYQQKHK